MWPFNKVTKSDIAEQAYKQCELIRELQESNRQKIVALRKMPLTQEQKEYVDARIQEVHNQTNAQATLLDVTVRHEINPIIYTLTQKEQKAKATKADYASLKKVLDVRQKFFYQGLDLDHLLHDVSSARSESFARSESSSTNGETDSSANSSPERSPRI